MVYVKEKGIRENDRTKKKKGECMRMDGSKKGEIQREDGSMGTGRGGSR